MGDSTSEKNADVPAVFRVVLSAWNSPTLMTWFSFFLRSAAGILVIPFLVTRFTPAEQAVWELFMSVIALQMLAQFGFTPSFVRAIGYSLAKKDGSGRMESASNPSAFDTLAEATTSDVSRTMKTIFGRLAFVSFAVLVIVGPLATYRMIGQIDQPTNAWIAWGVVCCVTPAVFYGLIYVAYLQGINQVPLLRRWEGLFALISVIVMPLVLLCGGGLLLLVIVHQGAMLGNVLVNRHWVRNAVQPPFDASEGGMDSRVLQFVWPAAWRSGMGILMARGVLNVSAIVLAQILPAIEAASMLMSLRILQSITSFSQAPFYSKVPQMIRLYAERDFEKMLGVAKKGMFFSHLAFAFAVTTAGLLAPRGLQLIKSNTPFLPADCWLLFVFAFFLQRYGAMHIQLYSLTNRIIWHIANGITGLIVIFLLAVLGRSLGMYSLPIAWLIGHAAFYTWFAARKSYQEFGLRFPDFEFSAALIGAILLGLGSSLVFMLS